MSTPDAPAPLPLSPLHHVGTYLTFDVTGDELVLALQLAPASSAMDTVEERLDLLLDGQSLATPVQEIATEHGGRVHVVRCPPGVLAIDYAASVRVRPGPTPSPPGTAEVPVDAEALVALRQSRYCPSDALTGFATAEFGRAVDGPTSMPALVAGWVHRRLDYIGGSSGPLDTAVDTLLSQKGVCRDFAHLTIALCRALGIPARLVAVYAPGLAPMDFHAVAEVRVAGTWQVLDSTRLAPRPSLVRIATGRDAADTAFATTVSGDAELLESEVRAVVDGVLPYDDHTGVVTIA